MRLVLINIYLKVDSIASLIFDYKYFFEAMGRVVKDGILYTLTSL